MGLFTKSEEESLGKFKIKKREEFDRKGILEKEYYTVSELYRTTYTNRFTGNVTKTEEFWSTMSDYKWVGFKSELGPHRVFDGYVEFSLEQAQEYIAKRKAGDIKRIVETEIPESALAAE